MGIFDFQKVLILPFADVSTFYYKRNWNMYNFSVFCTTTGQGYCYTWLETEAKKGGNEVATCLERFVKFEMGRNPDTKEIILWADNCFGQNKNKIVFSFCLWAAKHYNVKISLKYLTKEHTQNEVDSVHAAIERRRKHHKLYDTTDYNQIIKHAKVNAPFYDVPEMEDKDFLNFYELAKSGNFSTCENGEKFYISKIKMAFFDPTTSGNITFVTDWSSRDMKQIKCFSDRTKRGRKSKDFVDFEKFAPNSLYSEKIPISDLKYADLMSLCKDFQIPEKYHNFYRSLPHTTTPHHLEEDDFDNL